MKIGIAYTNAGPMMMPETAAALAEAAEACGVESLWTVEHVVVPVGYESAYPYSKTGKMPGGENVPIADPLIFLAWLAARTETVRLGTGILILPQRNPLIVAKEVATIDMLSQGRVLLGVGVGWLREEFEALGVEFEARGKRAEEYIAAMRAVWGNDAADYGGEFVEFGPVKSYPKPADGGVPVIIGGHTTAAAKRAARIGDGFFPGRGDDTGKLIELMRSEAARMGRDPASIEVTVGMPADGDKIRQMAEEYGVDRVVLDPPAFSPAEMRPAFERLMDEVSGG